MNKSEVERYLREDAKELSITVEPVVTSTNTLLYQEALAGKKEGSVLLANAQTAGRGRQGHTFYSPRDTGIYMSILLRPRKVAVQEAARITSMAAVAVCEAIQEVTQKKAGIKWVNDVYMEGRKVCGILTEASQSAQTGYVDFVILGIGVNVHRPKEGFPKDIEEIAGTVLEENTEADNSQLAAAILNHFMAYYNNWDDRGYVDSYRKNSLVLGKEVTVLFPEGEKQARAIAMDEECHLLVQYPDGKEEWLRSGEISIRL